MIVDVLATTDSTTLSLHDALPISHADPYAGAFTEPTVSSTCTNSGYFNAATVTLDPGVHCRSEEHTSELQSRFDLVCRLLLANKHSPADRRCSRSRSPPDPSRSYR